MSISRPFELVRDLNDSKHLWKIAVRITDIWYVQLPPKPGHLEMILMDCKGDKIQVSVKKEEFNQWKDHLVENHTYVMHNFNVFHNDLQFKACNHAYRLQFTAGTTLREKEVADIPQFQYVFKKFAEILAGDFDADLLVDIIGVVDKMVFSQTQTSLKKVIFNLKDSSGEVMTCTLWDSHALKFCNCYNNITIGEPIIVLLTHARVKEGQGKYPPTVSNSWCGSKILIDDEIPDYQKYKDSFATLTLSCDSLSQGSSQLSQYSNLSDDDRFMYKAEVKSLYEIAALTSAEEITCVTIGTTAMFIVGKQGWYYDGCSKCTKKIDGKDVPFTCKCGTYNLMPTPRYKLDIKVIHENGSGRFVFWDRQCADIIGVSAFELRNRMVAEGEDDPKAFPLMLDMLLARTMAFRVKVQPSYHQSSVMRLSESTVLIKAIADQFGTLDIHTGSTSDALNGKCHLNDMSQYESSVSITADHDPDNLQLLTPAKRMSVDLDLELPQSPNFKSTQLSSSKVAKHIKTE